MVAATCILALAAASFAEETHLALENQDLDFYQEAKTGVKVVGWQQWNPNNCSQETGVKKNGSSSLRTWWSYAMWQDFPVIPGNEYEISIYAYIPSSDPLTGTKYGDIKIDWLESDQNTVIYGVVSQPVKKGLPTNQWHRVEVRGVAAPTAHWGRFVLEFKEGEGHGVILWDQARVRLVKSDAWFGDERRLERPLSVPLLAWVFQTGDSPAWKNPDFDTGHWRPITVPGKWEENGYPDYDGFAWYRATFPLPALPAEPLFLILGKIDDADETFVNGQRIGSMGRFPPDFESKWNATREYLVPAAALRFGGTNVLAVRVYDGGESGGIWEKAGGRTPLMPRLVNAAWLKLYFRKYEP